VPPRAASATGAAVAARLRRHGYDWRAELRALRAPVLVVHGAADVLDVAVARHTAAWLGEWVPARLAVLDGAGHMPFWEAPDALFAALQTFLDPPILPTEPPAHDGRQVF
jgi:pimeloyl-ACP methyl ester carboxylesterase